MAARLPTGETRGALFACLGLFTLGSLACGLASCAGNGASGNSGEDPTQPMAADLDDIDARAETARKAITSENADAELRRLEAELSGKK